MCGRDLLASHANDGANEGSGFKDFSKENGRSLYNDFWIRIGFLRGKNHVVKIGFLFRFVLKQKCRGQNDLARVSLSHQL